MTKRQLKKATICFILGCKECAIGYYDSVNCVHEVAETALIYQAMLERLEYIPDNTGGHCAICGMGSGLGHMDGCELAALLKESEVERDGKV